MAPTINPTRKRPFFLAFSHGPKTRLQAAPQLGESISRIQTQPAMEPEPYSTITCPHCFEQFSMPAPPPMELPASWDYDCEVCCRPMLIHFAETDQGIEAHVEPA